MCSVTMIQQSCQTVAILRIVLMLPVKRSRYEKQ